MGGFEFVLVQLRLELGAGVVFHPRRNPVETPCGLTWPSNRKVGKKRREMSNLDLFSSHFLGDQFLNNRQAQKPC